MYCFWHWLGLPEEMINSTVDISTIDFTKEERGNLAASPIINVIPLGESETGKTTMLR